MIYPMNIFSPDPVSKSVRTFIIFIAFALDFDVTKDMGYGSTLDMKHPEGGFTLPFPNNGLTDASSNDYGQTNSIGYDMAKFALGKVIDVDTVIEGARRVGKMPDPRQTQVYNGTASRTFTGDWIMIPQSLGESALCMAILWWVKYSAAPDRKLDNKIAILEPPHVYKIIFSNPLLHLALQYDQMALESYSINYFAQGYASTYSDMMPKMMSLSLTFKEFGIKTKKDWSIVG